jgi:hypothetical protein
LNTIKTIKKIKMMKKFHTILFLFIMANAFSQIISPNGNNLFYYNGAADVTFRYQPRGNGGRAFVHADGNILGLNFESDFTGGTRIGNDVFFKDGGNSYINSGNFGIGTSVPTAPLTVYGKSQFFPARIGSGDARSLEISNSSNMFAFVSNDYPVFLKTGGGDQPLILDAARVGIGTASPSAKLEIYNGTPGITSFKTIGINGYLLIDNVGSGENYYNASNFQEFQIGGTPKMRINSNGNVGIGTTNPTSKLTVAGDIHSREVKVTVNAGADFVFEKEYNLPTLDSVDKYIKENKHLPEIASAAEMKKDGINLSEMNIKLLQKVEELTLYTIEQEKKNNIQSKKIERLEKENEAFKSLSERLSKLENQSKQ